MTEQDDSSREDDWSREMEPRIIDEVRYILDAFSGERGIDIEVVPQSRGLGYLYAKGQLLVLERYFEGVVESLRRQHVPFGPDDPTKGNQGQGDGRNDGKGDEDSPDPNRYPHVLPGLILVYISGKSVPAVLDVIDRELGEGCATPNHVLTVANGYQPEESAGPCAATDPEEVHEGTEPYPGICHCNSGAGVSIYIADTGLIPDEGSHHIAGTEVIVDSRSEERRVGKECLE